MNKFFKIILPAIFLIVITFIIVAYWIKFGSRPISDDPAQWGQFGDYIGGLLNPIIGLANLFVIIYFGYFGFIKDKKTLKAQMMPLIHIEFEQTYSETGKLEAIGVLLKNCGFGPLILTDISFIGPNNEVQKDPHDIVALFSLYQDVRAWTYHNGKEGILDKGETRNLIKLQARDNNGITKNGFEYMKLFGLKITYKDIFGEEHILEKDKEDLYDGAEYFSV